MKPALFIGSSSEESDYASALQSQLTSAADVTIWDQGFFALNRGYLESLMDGLNDSDFGVFVFAPDDILKLRGETLAAVRDNVLFELGLFMGKLGRDRAFFVLPANQEGLRLPSDLLGVSTATFDASRDNIEASLGPACFRIRQAIKKFGVRQDRLAPPTVEIINGPRVLCACSRQYFHMSFQKDVELIRNETQNISARISELHSADSTSLTKTLMENEFDIVHISAFVDPKTGDIYFNDVGSESAPPDGVAIDSMSAITFSKLIELAKAKLVVLATCDSLVLAAKLAKVTNMVAAGDWVSCDDILKWELGLYKCLSKGISLSNSFETASSLSKAPMLLLLKKDLALIG
jgi:predicted nucleotide-binding protein with TIR-like domain